MNRRIIATIGSSAVLVGSFFISSLAAAQAAVPSLNNGTYQFRLNGDRKLCIVSHGVGRQLTVGTSGCANIKITNIADSGGKKFFTVGGKCIYAGGPSRVKIDTGSCFIKNEADVWIPTHNNPYRFQNAGTNGWLKTYDFVSGYKVWTGVGGRTDWNLVRQ